MNFVKEAYKIKAETIINNFKKRKIEGYYCETKNEALDKVLDLLEDGSSISWGGSITLDQIGIKDKLKQMNYTLIDRSTAKNKEEAFEIMRKGMLSDYFLTSSNAITMEGELINIDGNGNRVSSIIFGPKNVIVIAGMNKVISNLDLAIEKIRNDACPPNAIRLNLNTPCRKTGKCHDCFTDDCICSQIVITRTSRVPNRIKVILVGEELGF